MDTYTKINIALIAVIALLAIVAVEYDMRSDK